MAAWADWRYYVRKRTYWLLTLSACLLTGFSGPFRTITYLPLGERLVYWTVIIGFSVLLLTYLSFVAYRMVLTRSIHWALAAALAGVAGTPPIMAVVAILYSTRMGHAPKMDLGLMLFEVGIPAVVINVIVNAYIRLPPNYVDLRRRRQTPTQALDTPRSLTVTYDTDDQSLFFENLPPHLGRDIVSIRADNHYIEVTTGAGSARILMRLRDAETALAALPGLRVHRSWWVNLDHVTGFETRRGGSGQLTMNTGEVVPVSRAQVDAVRETLNMRA